MVTLRALILAAGQGTRLSPITDNLPKALTPLVGKPLILRQIETLHSEGISEIAIAAGYRAEMLKDFGAEIFINSQYASTNMVTSMMTAHNYVAREDGDLVISYGDIVYSRTNLRAVLQTQGDIVLMIDREWRKLWEARFSDPLSDAETFKLGPDGCIKELGEKPKSYDQIEGQYTGLMRVSASRINDFCEAYGALPIAEREPMYMTRFLQNLINAGWSVRPAMVESGWVEVDTVSDLELYERLQAEGRLSQFYEVQ